MSHLTRRKFLKRTAAVAGMSATFTVAGTRASGKVLGANDKIRVGAAGIRGRGSSHIKAFAGMDGVEVTYLIDPDERTWGSKSGMVEKIDGNKPKCVTDIRKALDDKNLDVITCATPNHWHSLITIWACQAGKDVYVEKPCSHNVFEGRKAVEAARKYKRIVQHGTQSRSSGGWAKQVAAIASGKYGKLLVSKGYASKPRWSIGFKEIKEPPKEVDFNLWLGPAQKEPYHENLVHYNWHWFWNFGNGEIGNQGVHQMDIARWAIPGGTLPKSVWSLGGRWVNGPDFKDQGQTPNMQLSVFDYGDTLLVFEVRGLVGKKDKQGKSRFPRKVDNEFYLEEGAIKGGKFYPKGKDKAEPLVDVEAEVQPNGPFGNFIDCVRSRNHDDLNAEILEGHLSSAVCHLGNAAYRLGKQVSFSKRPDVLGDNELVNDGFDDIKKNLAGALGMDLAKSTFQLSPLLKFDPKAEKFVDNAEANKLITRDYRSPFVVPESV